MNSALDAIGNTSLVPLDRVARGLPLRVFAKCEHMNPGGSIKAHMARSIIDDAEARAAVAPAAIIIEATARTTGVGVALVAAVRGYKFVCVTPEKMPMDKRTAVAALGAQVIITPNAPLSRAEILATSHAGSPKRTAGFSPTGSATQPT